MRNKGKLDIKKLIQAEQQNIAKNIKTNPKNFGNILILKPKVVIKLGI